MRDLFITEIEQQAAVAVTAARALATQESALRALGDLARRGDGPVPLVLTGMGSSYDALEALSTSLARDGHPAYLVNSAELVNYRLPVLRPGTVVVAVSQSGRSVELVRLAAEIARRGDVHLVAITNEPHSDLAAAAAVDLRMNAGEERGPATKSYLASMLVLDAVRRVLLGADVTDTAAAVTAAGWDLAEVLAGILDDRTAIIGVLRDWLGDAPGAYVVGRGHALSPAEVAALVLKESARVSVTGMDAAEFRHGPMELAGPDLRLAALGVEPDAVDRDVRLLSECADRGAHALHVLVGPAPAEPSPFPRLAFPAVTPMLDGVTVLTPFQLLAWSLAAERFAHPGLFVVGGKTTTVE